MVRPVRITPTSLRESNEHRPLDATRKEISVIDLLPGNYEDDIEIKIEHVYLPEPPDSDLVRAEREAWLEEVRGRLPPNWWAFDTPQNQLICIRGLEEGQRYPYTSRTASTEIPSAPGINCGQGLAYEALSYVWGSPGETHEILVCVAEKSIPT